MRQIIVIAIFAALPAFASRQFQAQTDTLLGGSPALPQSGTVSFMVNPQFVQNDGIFHMFFEVANTGASTYFQIVKGGSANNNLFYAAWCNGPNVLNSYAPVNAYTLPQNAWSNVVVTWVNGGALTIYLNGAAIASAQGAPWYSTAGNTWSFGNRASGGYVSSSKMAQFGVWSRVLGSTEIAAMASGAPPSTIPANLFAEYDLAGSSLAAQTGTGGTLVNSGPVTASDLPPPPSPTLSVAGASSGTLGSLSYFVAGETHPANAVVVTPSDGGAGGAFTPASATLVAGSTSATFGYAPTVAGDIAISISNDQGIDNPAPLVFHARAAPIASTLTVDATSKAVTRGTDVSFTITQATPSGYTGQLPDLRVANAPGSFTFNVSGKDCGAPATVIPYFGWHECGPTADGAYTLTVHTGSLNPGVYYFAVVESGDQIPNGVGVSLALTVK